MSSKSEFRHVVRQINSFANRVGWYRVVGFLLFLSRPIQQSRRLGQAKRLLRRNYSYHLQSVEQSLGGDSRCLLGSTSCGFPGIKS
jgi:hypothetical protein